MLCWLCHWLYNGYNLTILFTLSLSMVLAKSLTSTCTGELALLLAMLLFMALTMSLAMQLATQLKKKRCYLWMDCCIGYVLLDIQLSLFLATWLAMPWLRHLLCHWLYHSSSSIWKRFRWSNVYKKNEVVFIIFLLVDADEVPSSRVCARLAFRSASH